MMTDPHRSDPTDDAVRRLFNDIARTDLAGPPPRCECNCNGEEPHADRKCSVPGKPAVRRAALYLVALHRFGWCRDEPTAHGIVNPAAVDADGNMTAYMCQICTDHAVAVTRRNVNILLGSVARGDIPRCDTCGRAVARWQDLMERRPV